MNKTCTSLFLVLLTGFAVQSQSTQSLVPDHPNGVYARGEAVHWRIETNSFSRATNLTYTIKSGGLASLQEGRLSSPALATNLEARLSGPGTVLLEIKAKGENTPETRVLGGAIVEPDKIAPALPPPVDFADFWKAKIHELEAIPANTTLTSFDSDKPGIDYWKILMDNIRGTHIPGQLARRKGDAKLPAMLIVQWAGVYPLQKAWVLEPAAQGWLVLNINAHDLPIDESPEFYQKQSEGPLKNYPSIENDDRDKSYFLRMYLSCYRAAQYLAERPDWDGNTLLVTGNSQGGLQALVTAAIHPKITAVIAGVPAGCDLNGPMAGRSPGWPMWYWNTGGKDPEKVRTASRYYDVVNFASRISCPILVGVGLIDETCPPAGILAALNQAKGRKEIVFLPQGAHQDSNNSHRPFADRAAAWKTALVKGEPPPIQ